MIIECFFTRNISR